MTSGFLIYTKGRRIAHLTVPGYSTLAWCSPSDSTDKRFIYPLPTTLPDGYKVCQKCKAKIMEIGLPVVSQMAWQEEVTA